MKIHLDRQFQRKVSLTSLLSGLVAASVLFTIIIQLVVSYKFERDNLIHTTLSLNYSNADKISNTVYSLFSSMQASLESIGKDFSGREQLDDNGVQRHLEVIWSNSHYFNSIAWINEEGFLQNVAPIGSGLKGMRANPMVLQAIQDRHSFISEPYMSLSGHLVILVGEPFYDMKGGYRGMIAGVIYLQEDNVLNEILGYNQVDKTGSYYYVVGPDGKLLYHPQNERLGETVLKNEIVQKVLRGLSGGGRVTNTVGVDMLAAYSPIPEMDWGVVQQTPVSSINKQLNHHMFKQFLYLIIPIIFLILIAMFVARKLAKPFVTMANLVHTISAGRSVELPTVRRHWNREADVLTRTVYYAIEELQQHHNQLIHEVTTDALTGLGNRRMLDEILENCKKVEPPQFSIMVIDIDHFKSINDTFGHPMGDAVLKHVARILKIKTRKTDFCFRYGGEEFVVLLMHTSAAEAHSIAEKLRKSIEKSVTPVSCQVTISCGIAEYPKHSNSLDALFSLADKALYCSKKEGRNRTTVSEGE